MRARDFLTEGGLASRDFYERYRLANLIQKLDTGEKFITTDGKKVVVPASRAEIAALKSQLKNNFDPKNKDPKARAITPLVIPPSLGGIKLSALQKTKEFGGKVGTAPGQEEDFSKANLGPTVEALKSFAMYAKLSMRGKSTITVDDVIKIGKLADENSKVDYAVNPDTGKKSTTLTTFASYSRNVPDVSKQVKDQLTLNVALSTPSFQRAVRVNAKDKAAWGNLQGVISYVNSESDIGKYSRFFANNNKRDPVKISVIGIGGAKTDISSTYVDPKTGSEKPLQHLSLSVKSAGAEWYDQAPGGNEDGMRKFYGIIGLDDAAADSAMKSAKFKGGGKKDTTPETFAERIQSVYKIYGTAYKQLKSRIPQLNDKGEADYIHGFVGRLKSSLAGDEKLVYVKFDADGTYKKLNPQILSQLSRYIDLDVNYVPGQGDSKPRIFWIDNKTGKTLLYVVLLVNAPNYRLTHQFNLGKDFFELLRLAGEAANPVSKPVAAPVQPIDTPPQSTAKPIKLGPPNAKPGKLPVKAKTQQLPQEPGDQMGVDPSVEPVPIKE
jgi:hypothetical protein